MTMPLARLWFGHISQGIDHHDVVATVREDSGWSSHFAFMVLMSAGIAVLGMLLSSPAVVIGAMLISPLMGPIIGFGFALATFDAAELRKTGRSMAGGAVLAVVFCAMIVTVSPLQSVTTEIASRTRPNLFDLLIALFSGLAGTYAMIRGRHGAIVGVAIATALMPPLAVMGFGLATMNWQVLGGSTLLFFTNLMTIAASAAVLARFYGFAPGLSPHQTRLQAALIIVTLIALAIPLGFTLRQIAWEALARREASATIAAQFPRGSRVNDLDINYHATPIEITGTVLTPQYREVSHDLPKRLSEVLGRPAAVTLDQIRTENGPGNVAKDSTAVTSAQRNASRTAERLALVAGVPIENVVVDRSSKTAIVRAAPLAGADLAAYRALEERVAAADTGWKVILIPPFLPLPDVSSDGDTVDQGAVDTIIWAAKRLGLPVAVVAGSDADGEQIAGLLRQGGADARIVSGAKRGQSVQLRWALASTKSEAP
ncbi:MAG: DUF389 domain-containing protein [Sphingomicrobium sp.]